MIDDAVRTSDLGDIRPAVTTALELIGMTWEEFWEAATVGQVMSFMDDLPTRYVTNVMRSAKHRQSQQKWEPNDFFDILGLPVAAVYCDVVVTEKQWAHRMRHGKVDQPEEQSGGSPQATLNGLKADVYVYAGAVSCGRITSVYVRNSTYTRLMEFGWAKGKFACYSDQTYVDFTQETPFAVAFEPNARYCKKYTGKAFSGSTNGMNHNFRSSDKNQNGYWGPWLDGDELEPDGFNLTFTQGLGGVNGERENPNDPNNANFTSIQELHATTWSATDSMGDPYDTDPGYHIVVDAGNHVRFVAN